MKSLDKNIKKIQNKPSKKIEKQVIEVNKKILNLNPEIKLIIEMSSILATEAINKNIDKIIENASYKSVYSGYKQVYKSIIIGADYASANLVKINNLLDKIIEKKQISRAILIDSNLNFWDMQGNKKIEYI